jgi:hypothetical protein
MMMKSKRNNSARDTSGTTPADAPIEAKEHYRREKARRARHAPVDSEAMASARREYQALLETSAKKGRGGRPKKQPKPPADDPETEDEAGA